MSFDKLELITRELFSYEGTRPHGIRDRGGYLLFFPKITSYTGQPERFKREIAEQHELAETIMTALTNHFPMCTVCNEIICECKFEKNEEDNK